MTIYCHFLGKEHPEVVTCHNNLSSLLRSLGDVPGARACFEQSLAVRPRALGDEHPVIVTSPNKLGGLQRGSYRRAKAVIMSRLSILDGMTGELMEAFYLCLLAGEGRADVFLNAQLALRRREVDPYCWGPFICPGNSGPLHGNRIWFMD